jgi:ABC-type Fe3+/spermidine/putrescine transport system ATPase subunit
VTGAGISCRGVSRTHPGGAAPALDRVDLDAAAGRTLVLLGPSGAGKTTLLRILAGLEEPDAGEVRVGERVVADPRTRVPAERRGIGFVFQHLELWPHMTVAENVAFGLPGRPRGRRAAGHPTVTSLAERVGIAPLLSRRPPTLSGGERQRVAIARALAPAPAALLYDEPLANLDPDRRADVRRLIRSLAREHGTTLVYVTHDADEAMEMGDEVVVMARGRVVERGAPADLYRVPKTLGGARAVGPLAALPARLEGDGVRTALGLHALAAPPEPGADLAVVRPEAVEVAAEGTEAVVVEARPRGADWAFVAETAGVRVAGRSAGPLGTGERVRLRVRGPVALVRGEGS